MDILDLRWSKGEPEAFGEMKIRWATADHLFTDELIPSVGVDPGRNWAIAFVTPKGEGFELATYWATMPKEVDSQDYFHKIRDFVKAWVPSEFPYRVAMVEGSSYGDRYGQQLLEQCRLGFYEAFRELGCEVSYVSPKTPRKWVLGNGNINSKGVWLDLNHNGADAACIALYAGGYKHPKYRKENE